MTFYRIIGSCIAANQCPPQAPSPSQRQRYREPWWSDPVIPKIINQDCEFVLNGTLLARSMPLRNAVKLAFTFFLLVGVIETTDHSSSQFFQQGSENWTAK
ncbi:hypothetical protein PILCRDRAFT_739055 [Piloderma croceum F 1598]|uniref:Uncharacterized protein n=1 Tax=Piloderma croceum (strain F 1598) TaxID=765440 RepID=A0A0C3AFR6_PILCF|nr:hypothetical protein PILCRDRAFT_739055 [Piloderma croceum F 1598]